MLIPTDPVSTTIGDFHSDPTKAANLSHPPFPVELISLDVSQQTTTYNGVVTGQASPIGPDTYDTLLYVTVTKDIKAKTDLVKFYVDLTFRWNVLDMQNPYNEKVQIAYQVLYAPVPENTPWEKGAILGHGIVDTSLEKKSGGKCKLTNEAWKNVTWAFAKDLSVPSKENPGVFATTVFVRMVPIKKVTNALELVAPTKLATPTNCVQLFFGPPFKL